ncbi:Protein of unknown function DUF2625 [Corynebacterium mustelae]|uniref:DUF2625 family protein n=1 Tax=Corynebacterium mustelae TaxID=571915 RepID=A0A0G3GZ05_9CORY|nr:DUF2625 family protein [Corynebacterium mustelae]AKK05745.1 Protein of unknown function DUF2625 [Corynebacterium mustelae]
MEIRTIEQLTDVTDPAWGEIQEAIKAAPVAVDVLPTDSGADTLHKLQVTTHSTLGGIAYNCGGILIDHGWVRLYGGGGAQLPSIAEASGITEPSVPGALIFGHDVLGGRFAIDGGALGISPGEVCYFSPDGLEWEGLDMGHSGFVHAFLGGATTKFYDLFRWEGWEADTKALKPDQGFMVFPPLFSRENPEVDFITRTAVPMQEIFAFYETSAASNS